MARIADLASLFLAIATFLAIASSASAHFIWIDAPQGADVVRLVFGESPKPAGRDLTQKIAHSKLWSRAADGKVTNLSFKPGTDANAKTLVATAERKGKCFEATCDYGVYSHGGADGPGVLLHYFAKWLPSDWRQYSSSFARSERLELDIVPHCRGRNITFNVFFKGKPAAGQEVVLLTPTVDEHTMKTDDEGRAVYENADVGRYCVRAGYIQPDLAGERDGKKYNQTWNYCTLSFEGGEGKTEAHASSAAAAALAAARANRAVWKNFPGFKAKINVSIGGEKKTGQMKLDADGNVTFTLPDSKEADWARDQLESLAQHRMPDGEVSEGNVIFGESDDANPLGRQIVLDDGERDSTYRIKDNIIMEVCRNAGPMRFTISVLEVQWTKEKKYLPRSFVMNFFDTKSGELRESLAYLNEWQRVGSFDIPVRIVEVDSEKPKSTSKVLALSDVELLPKK